MFQSHLYNVNSGLVCKMVMVILLTVVIHLEDANATDAAMMSAIWLHAFAFLAVPNAS